MYCYGRPQGNLWFNRKENKDRIKVAKAIEEHSMDTYGVLCVTADRLPRPSRAWALAPRHTPSMTVVYLPVVG